MKEQKVLRFFFNISRVPFLCQLNSYLNCCNQLHYNQRKHFQHWEVGIDISHFSSILKIFLGLSMVSGFSDSTVAGHNIASAAENLSEGELVAGSKRYFFCPVAWAFYRLSGSLSLYIYWLQVTWQLIFNSLPCGLCSGSGGLLFEEACQSLLSFWCYCLFSLCRPKHSGHMWVRQLKASLIRWLPDDFYKQLHNEAPYNVW